MGVFEYIGVLISVIMGLGITHLATGATKLIQHRDEVRFYLPHMLWTANILVFILLIWWGMFSWSGHHTWHASEYLFITLYSITAFFLASMLYPWDMARDINVREYFFKNRVWFFGGLLVAWWIDIAASLVKADSGLRPIPQGYVGFICAQMLIPLIGIASRNHVIQIILPVIFLAFVVLLVLFSDQSQISG
ncbi:MAG: hypothetical protein KJO31_19345 [Gammaproteobacteria bacterium]|nr:hypothetical protein [Gammaproteobacteria bacterium]